MLENVDLGERTLAAYRGLALEPSLEEVRTVAEPLRGARVLHLSATAYGGGVSELLRSLVPLQRDLGIAAEWRVIAGEESFFRVTKGLHNGLQGEPAPLDEHQREIYMRTSERNAALLDGGYDFVVVHDPQPAAVRQLRPDAAERWIWRCHVDSSAADPHTLAFMSEILADYDAAVFTSRDFVPPGFPIERVEIVPPAIDPLSPKNLSLPASLVRQVLGWTGIDLASPLVTQVSRFDHWKDPFGVIDAYRLAREGTPGLQLALVGSMALDDPEAWGLYHSLVAESRSDPLIHVFTNLTGIGNIEVNAFQRHSDVIVQKSIREGFGLVVSEALWKATPVVAGRAGGIPLQLADGVGGVLVDGVEECARAIAGLLADPERADALARSGSARIRGHFLLPRLLLNELDLLLSLAGTPNPGAHRRDPVCGMVLGRQLTPMARGDGELAAFCSEDCRRRFVAEPGRFAVPSPASGALSPG